MEILLYLYGAGSNFIDESPAAEYTIQVGLDPDALYTLHDCTVELSFTPE